MKTAGATLKNWLANIEYGLNLSGVAGQTISIPDAPSLHPTVGVSYEIWTIPRAGGATGLEFYRKEDSTNRQLFRLSSFGLNIGGVYSELASGIVYANVQDKLTHYVATFDGNGRKIFLNGTQIASDSVAGALNTTGTALAYIGSSSNSSEWYIGLVDGLRIYNRALSAGEVLAHYQGVYNNERALAARWEFDEGSGTVINDLSGNGNNGTFVGTPTYELFTPIPNRRKQWVQADLYTFTLVGGAVYRYTSADRDLTIGGNTFSSLGPRIARGKTKLTNDLQADSIDITIFAKLTDTIGGTGWLAALASGAFDGATVLVQRFLSDAWTNTALGVIHQFQGMVGSTTIDRGKAQMKVNSQLILLNKMMPRNIILPTCLHTLYDSGCGLTKSAFATAGSVAAGSTASSIMAALAAATGYYDLGTIVFTSGALNGISRTVKQYTFGTTSQFSLLQALPSVPSPGDTFNIYPGCDKLLATCTNKFANKANYRGFDFVPQPETAI